jgi:hypothetical protein
MSVALVRTCGGWLQVRGRRKDDAHGEPAVRHGVGADAGVVDGGDGSDNGQSKAVTVLVVDSAGIETLEWPEETVDFTGRNDRAPFFWSRQRREKVTVSPGQRVGRTGLGPVTPCASRVFDVFRAVHPNPLQTPDQDLLFKHVHCRP